MDINGRVIMSLETYDNLQMELIEAQDEIKRLSKELNSIEVFELQKSYGDKKKLVYTAYAQEQYADLVARNPHLKFKELDNEITWDIAEPKEETEGDSDD